MVFSLRTFTVAILVVLIGVFTWKVCAYLFDTSSPAISLVGLCENSFYCGDVCCSVKSNKSGEISIRLDNQLLTRPCEAIKCNRDYPFTIPTQTLTDGKHTIRIDFTDYKYHKNAAILTSTFFVDNLQLQAALVQAESDYKVLQGRTLHIQAQANKEVDSAYVYALGNKYRCFPEAKDSLIYECFVPILCEETPNEYAFSLEIADKVGNAATLDGKFQVILYPFKKQSLHVSADKVKEEKEKGAAQNLLERAIDDIVCNSPGTKLWRGTFCMPTEPARVTCEFGTVRTTKEKGRYTHCAVDLVNIPGSVIWAPQDGIISHVGRYESSGNTVVIDHGLGVVSLFFHLEDFAAIKVGQKIAKGNPIGIIGKTGYATGCHLHWEMRLSGVPVDPLQWTNTKF